jgi:hypothetical protein
MYPFGSNGASQAILDADAQADLKEVEARYKRLAGGFDAETLSSKCGFATLLDPLGGRPASAGLGALNTRASWRVGGR